MSTQRGQRAGRGVEDSSQTGITPGYPDCTEAGGVMPVSVVGPAVLQVENMTVLTYEDADPLDGGEALWAQFSTRCPCPRGRLALRSIALGERRVPA